MELVFAIGVVVCLIYAGVQLVLSVFKPPRKVRLKKAFVGLGLMVASFVGFAAQFSPDSPGKHEPSQQGPAAQVQTAAVATPATPPPPSLPTVPPQDPNADYMERLDSATALLEGFKAKDFTSDIKSIMFAVEMLNSSAAVYDRGGPLSLTAEQQQRRKKLRNLVSQRQKDALPVLRDAYGPVMRKELWEHDGKAKTFGSGYRTVEFVNGHFAANRNIKAFHEEALPVLMKLRFTRANYKWIDAATEYSYYTISPPADGELVTWRTNGDFAPID